MSESYSPYVNPVSLEASSWQFGDAALASALGSSAIVSGADSAKFSAGVMSSAPEILPKSTNTDEILDFYSSVSEPATQNTVSSFYERNYGLIWSVVLVVLALFMFSRGIGMIGEEASSTVLEFGDSVKYPGIGHAVKAFGK